jgi:hypothetical protein
MNILALNYIMAPGYIILGHSASKALFPTTSLAQAQAQQMPSRGPVVRRVIQTPLSAFCMDKH